MTEFYVCWQRQLSVDYFVRDTDENPLINVWRFNESVHSNTAGRTQSEMFENFRVVMENLINEGTKRDLDGILDCGGGVTVPDVRVQHLQYLIDHFSQIIDKTAYRQEGPSEAEVIIDHNVAINNSYAISHIVKKLMRWVDL